MSNVTNDSETVELALDRLPGRGGRRYRVTALLGARCIHVDTINIENAEHRRKLIQAVSRKASELGVVFDEAEYDQLLIDQATTIKADSSSDCVTAQEEFDCEAVLETAGIVVLGEQDDQSILIWVPSTGKHSVIHSPGKWSEMDILQAIGQRGIEILWTDTRTPVPAGKITVAQLQRAVSVTASQAPRVSNDVFIGQGVSRSGDKLVVVNGDAAFEYDGQNVCPIQQPRMGQKIIEFNPAKRWADGIERTVQAVTDESARAVLSQLRVHLQKWNWTHRADADVAAALIPATLVQAYWTWRPLVTLTGESDCGKSTLLEQFLKPVFGDWTIHADRSTEAGLRQAIGNDFSPVLLDEFDTYQHRSKVLELFRTASRGGHVLRGTKDQTGRSYGVRHIPWFAAIESGDTWSQDRNRRIRLELNRPTNRGTLVLPNSTALRELGQQVGACALWAASAAARLADELKCITVPGVHGRLIECFSVPAAMHAVLRRGRSVTAEVAAETLRAMIDGRETLVVQGESEQVRLLQDIMASNIRVPVDSGDRQSTEDRSVGQLLQPQVGSGLAANAWENLLEAKGIALYNSRGSSGPNAQEHGRGERYSRATGGRRLFIAHDTVKRELLAGTRWSEDVQIDQLLLRLPGAERSQQRCGAGRPWGVSLPWPACLEGQDAPQDVGSGDGHRS